MMNCRIATELISAAQERELKLTERMSLGVHTMMCKGCRNYEHQMGILRTFTRAFAKGESKIKDK